MVSIASVAAAIFACSGLRADITLIGTASIPGDAIDKSGLTSVFGDKMPHNRLGSFGSSIDFTGKDDLYVAPDDRGPNNGELPFRARFQTFKIGIEPGGTPAVKVDLMATTLLTTESGEGLTGLSSAFSAKDQRMGARFDAEGVRVSAHGTLFISDEYGPWIDEFSMEGKRLKRLAVPGRYFVEHPDADAEQEVAGNTKGRIANRGFEGLAISPDKTKLWAILQSPLIQDGGVSSEHKRIGLNNRILEITLATGATRELVYHMESHKHGVSEMLAINDHEMLVLERDGSASKMRALYRIDIAGATDVSKVDALPTDKLPETIKPVTKKMWLDFTDEKFGLKNLPGGMPEKIEGLTFGPNLADGRRTLVATIDNDLITDKPSWFWVFAVDAKELAPSVPMAEIVVPAHE